LLERAKAEGVSLVGPSGLLAGVTKTVLQAALGGSCRIDSSPGRGTTVAGRIGLANKMAGNAGAVLLTGRMG
jgi:hypothetical protein